MGHVDRPDPTGFNPGEEVPGEEGGGVNSSSTCLWTYPDQEMNAVQGTMATFTAIKRVPAKKDCLLYIGKESPVLPLGHGKTLSFLSTNDHKMFTISVSSSDEPTPNEKQQ